MQRFSAYAMVVAAGLSSLSMGCKATTDTTVPRDDGNKGVVGKAEEPPTEPTASPAEIFASSDLPEPLAAPVPGDPMKATIHRLSNGMTVYISTDRQKPRFTGWIGVRAGSRMDPADSTGLAHYLEHMLFKGTDEYGTLDAQAEADAVENVRKLYAELRTTDDSAARTAIFKKIDAATQEIAKTAVPNEHSRMYSSLGVEGINAFTSFERTVYIADIPSNRLEAWATVEAERFQDPVFRLFYPELEAVYEEKNLSLDNPFRQVWEAMQLAIWPQHPYGTQTTIGSVDHLKNPAYQDMADYFHRWYVPNNMAISLAGDIDAKTALPILEEKFKAFKPRPLEKPAPGKVVPIKGRVKRVVEGEGEEGISIAWLTVPSAHADEPVLAVMDRVLDDASVGLLNVELELTQKVPEAGSWHSTLIESGYFGMRARARDGQSPKELERLLKGVVAKLKKGEFTEADVDAAKLQYAVQEKQRLEQPWSRASEMMGAFVEHRKWSDIVAREKAFHTVTRKDVIRVANEYLGSNYVIVVKKKGDPEIPKLEKPKITPVKIDPSRSSKFARKVLAMQGKVLEPEWLEEGKHYVHRKLEAGELIAAKNERNDLFELNYRFNRGYRKAPLLCYALDLLELSGAGDKSAEQVQKELYALGSTVYTSCNAEQTWVVVEGLDRNLEPTLLLLDEWLADPKFDDKILERLFKNTITRRRDGLEEDWRLTSALDLFAMYGRDSAWLKHAPNKQLERANTKKLRKLITGVMNFKHTTMYFGPRSADDVAKIAARGKRHKKTGDIWIKRYRKVAEPRVFFLHKDGAKANVRFVIPRAPLPRDERPVANLLSEYLSGNMSALVFQEIRESRGLAYSAYSYFDDGRRVKDASGLRGFLSTQADKTPVAVETFLGLLQSDDVQGDRLTSAKVSIDEGYRSSRIDPRRVTNWVVSWDDKGEPKDPRPWERDAIAKLGVKETAAFAKQFVGAPVIVAVVGDRERVDLDALRKIGAVQELKPPDLFSYGAFPPKEDPKVKEAKRAAQAKEAAKIKKKPGGRAGTAKKKKSP